MPGRKPARRSSALVPVTTSAMPRSAASGVSTSTSSDLQKAHRSPALATYPGRDSSSVRGCSCRTPRETAKACAASRSAAGRLGETAVAATTRPVPSARTAAASTTPESTPPEKATSTPGTAASSASSTASRSSRVMAGSLPPGSAGREADRDPGDLPGVLGQRDPPAGRGDGGVQPRRAAGRDPLAVAERDRLLGGQLARREDRPGGVGQPDDAGSGAGLGERCPGLLDRPGLAGVERTGGGAAQRGEVATDAEGGTQVAGDGPDVGAGAAGDGDVYVDQVRGGPVGPMDVDPVHGHRAGGQLELLTGAHPVVGASAVDLHRADRRRHLLQRTHLPGQRGPDVVVGDPGRRRGRGDLALPVVGDRRLTQPDGGVVGLVRAGEVPEQPGGRADTEHEQAGGHRVERAGVPDLAHRQPPPGARDDVVGGHATGLVDQQQGRWDVGVGASRAHGETVSPSQALPRTRSRTATSRSTMNSVSPVHTPGRPQSSQPDSSDSGTKPSSAEPRVTVRRNAASPAPISTPSRAKTTPASGCISARNHHTTSAWASTAGSSVNSGGSTGRRASSSTATAVPVPSPQRTTRPAVY